MWTWAAADYARRGWVSVNLGYRLAVSDGIPGDGQKQMDDIETAVTYFGSKPYVDRAKLIIQGDSAGGHLATLEGAKMRGAFQGVISWSPVAIPWNAYLDSPSLGRRADEFWNSISRGTDQTVSGLPYIKAYPDTPPQWFAASDGDWVKWRTQGKLLCDALGPKCEAHVVPGTLHGDKLRDARPGLQAIAYQWAAARVGYGNPAAVLAFRQSSNVAGR